MRIHVLIALAGLATGALFAQEYRATFSGIVTDPTGAAIPKATVVATETRTGVKNTAVSEDTGAYTIPFLSPGVYEITAEAAGFKKFIRPGLALSAGDHPVIDIHLEVGAVSDSVTVSTEAPMIVASTASVGQIVTTQEVEELPVNGRSPVTLMNLAMGVILTVDPGPVRPFDQPAGGIAGGVSGNEYLLNGAPNNNASAGGASAWSPPQDAVTEVRVNVFDSDASMGHAGGGTANLITKSGTNGLHGSAYEFNQSSVMDANSFFANKAGTPRPAYHYNQYGMTAGGPLWVPKIFNGKNRVFWFFGYEGLRDSDPASSPLETGTPAYNATVPTPAERQGDLSALLKANKPGVDYTIYDPATGVASGTLVARTPFPNNIIPSARLNPIAQKYMQFFPQANTAGGIDGFGNFVITAVDSDGYDNEFGRLDISLSDRLRQDIRTLTAVAAEPGGTPPTVDVKATEQRSGYRIETISLHSDPGIEVSGLVAIPEGAGAKPAVLMLDSQPKERLAGVPSGPGGDLDRLAKAGRIVMVLEPRPSPPGTEGLKSPFMGYFNLLSLRAFLVGKTIVGMRMDDTIRAIDWLCARQDVDRSAITAYGNGPLGMVLLHAAALDTRIGRVVVENTLATYRMIVDQPIHRNASEVVIPGVLRKYDTGDLLLAVYPRPVTIINPQDALGTEVSEGEFRKDLAYVFQSDQKLGQAQRIRLMSRGFRDPLPID